MSYDLYIGDRDFNYTWNLSRFFRDFIQHGDETGLSALQGLTGVQSMVVLRNALESIQRESRNRGNGVPTWRYLGDQYDPDNCWGDVMSATLFITELYFAASDNKRKKWSFST